MGIDSLLVGLLSAVVLGAALAVSDDFADTVRGRSLVWTIFWGIVTVLLYLPTYLLEYGIITLNDAMGLPQLRAWIAGLVGLNWLTSTGFLLGMITLTLAFSGQEHDELLTIRNAGKYLSPILFFLGLVLAAIQFIVTVV